MRIVLRRRLIELHTDSDCGLGWQPRYLSLPIRVHVLICAALFRVVFRLVTYSAGISGKEGTSAVSRLILIDQTK